MITEHLEFESESPEADGARFVLEGFRGLERVSRLYEYELRLSTPVEGGLSPDAIDDLLRSPCAMRFGAVGESVVHGRLRAIELAPMTEPSPVVYRAWLVPRLFGATLTRRSRVFQHLSVPAIVARVLTEHGLERDRDFVLLASPDDYPAREYTVQYDETDFAFISRLLEHEGIFYYFLQLPSALLEEPQREYVVIGDRNAHFVPPRDDGPLHFDPRPRFDDDARVVRSLSRRTEVRPASVVLVDYDWRKPGFVVGQASADQATGQASFHHHYAEHFHDNDAGARLARIRAEELTCDRVVYEGTLMERDLAPGHRFLLEGYPAPELDVDYVVTEIEHGIERGAITGGESVRHEKRFRAIASTTPFRPRRETPKPRIDGIVHGLIDSEDVSSDLVAPVDAQGRYTVVLPYDLNGRPGGAASTRRIRMAQPASGNTNMHFPLDVGAEVSIAHIAGDPDRPIIVGSPPHGRARVSVDVGGDKDNRSQSLIESRGGILIQFDDDA